MIRPLANSSTAPSSNARASGSSRGSSLLLEIVDHRHGRGSTIVTTQLPVAHCHEVADAVVDCLVQTAHRLTLDGETLRKPPEKTGKRGKLDTDATA
jgi:IstB-like ATP binding protein